MSNSPDKMMDFIHTQCSLLIDNEYAPIAAYPIAVIYEELKDFATKNVGSEITAGIVLEIIGFISLPFMLIEVFFKALLYAFVLLGVAIKSVLDKDMGNFKTQCRKTGEVLLSNIKTTGYFGLISGSIVRDSKST